MTLFRNFRIAIPSLCKRNDHSVCAVLARVNSIKGRCTLAFAKEFLEEEPISNDHDSDDDNFLPLLVSDCSDVTATKSNSLSEYAETASYSVSEFFKLFSSFNI